MLDWWILMCNQIVTGRGVHQTAQTAKTARKCRNRIAPHCMVQCGLRFYNKKTAPQPFYILIYLFIFNINIKYIINSLITLASVDQKSQLKIKKNQLNNLKLGPKKGKNQFLVEQEKPKI